VTRLPAVAALVALTLLGAACKKEPAPPEPPRLSPAPLRPAGEQPPPGAGQLVVPPELDPGKGILRRGPHRLPPVSARALRREPVRRAVRVGAGTLSATVGEAAVTVAATVYQRGALYLLSGERPGMGLVLSLPSLAPGSHLSAPGAAAPDLRVRSGTEVLSARDGPAGALAVRITESGRTVRGAFQGRVSRDGGQAARPVREGKFELVLDAP
jgi:hypothetical protein